MTLTMQRHRVVDLFRNFNGEVRSGHYFVSGKLAYFLRQLSSGAYVHFLNVFLKDVGLNTAEVGFIAGLTYAGMSLCGPLIGLLIDHTGRRQLIYASLAIYISIGVLAMPFVAHAINHHHHHLSPNSTARPSTPTHSTMPPPLTYEGKSFSSNIFFAMLVLDITAKCVGSVLPSMMDAAVMSILERKPSCKYGGSRMWGSIGFGIGAVIAGSATDRFAYFFEERGLSKYTAAFALAAVLQVISLPMVLYVLSKMTICTGQTKNSKDPKNMESGDGGEVVDSENNDHSKVYMMFKTFKNVDNIMFLLTVLIGGVSLMSLTGFLLIFMGTMNATTTMKGAAVQVQSWVQVLIFPISDMIIKKVGGTVVAMEIGILSFGIRFVADAYIRNSGLILFTQLFHAFGSALFWCAAVAHTKAIASTKTYVTTFAMVTGVYYGCGGLLGNMLGGAIYHKFGGKILFLSMGVVTGVWFTIMLLYFHVGRWVSKRSAKNTRVKPLDNPLNLEE